MREILLEAALLGGEEIFAAIKQCDKTINALKSGDVSEVLKELVRYRKELTKEAVSLDVCPRCGGELVWSYSFSENTPYISSFLLCPGCGYKSLIRQKTKLLSKE